MTDRNDWGVPDLKDARKWCDERVKKRGRQKKRKAKPGPVKGLRIGPYHHMRGEDRHSYLVYSMGVGDE